MAADAFDGRNDGFEIVPSLYLGDIRYLPSVFQGIDPIEILLDTDGVGREEILRGFRSAKHEKDVAGYFTDSERLFLRGKGSGVCLFFRNGIAEEFEEIGDHGFRVLAFRVLRNRVRRGGNGSVHFGSEFAAQRVFSNENRSVEEDEFRAFEYAFQCSPYDSRTHNSDVFHRIPLSFGENELGKFDGKPRRRRERFAGDFFEARFLGLENGKLFPFAFRDIAGIDSVLSDGFQTFRVIFFEAAFHNFRLVLHGIDPAFVRLVSAFPTLSSEKSRHGSGGVHSGVDYAERVVRIFRVFGRNLLDSLIVGRKRGRKRVRKQFVNPGERLVHGFAARNVFSFRHGIRDENDLFAVRNEVRFRFLPCVRSSDAVCFQHPIELFNGFRGVFGTFDLIDGPEFLVEAVKTRKVGTQTGYVFSGGNFFFSNGFGFYFFFEQERSIWSFFLLHCYTRTGWDSAFSRSDSNNSISLASDLDSRFTSLERADAVTSSALKAAARLSATISANSGHTHKSIRLSRSSFVKRKLVSMRDWMRSVWFVIDRF